ncbi:hypothetical protein EAH89_18245 [Roseomonas nepalensis]|uniref:Uncharacterized protein n=1 Tax=Muricoccus nepalensis TaxID=1854500 RepID=A0A502FTB8_9PROT|nr:hypothetical protein [Roseomonas nepalensis]TPG52502.1 hypothetical protein EAH89_18245 [Roseomonas nepalensis]
MSPDLTLTPVRLGTDAADEDGQLVFAGDFLVAVLVRLAEGHEAVGHWFLEHGFGRLHVTVPPTFSDLQAAKHWIAGRLSGIPAGGSRLSP